jgi:hypothetical protein
MRNGKQASVRDLMRSQLNSRSRDSTTVSVREVTSYAMKLFQASSVRLSSESQ